MLDTVILLKKNPQNTYRGMMIFFTLICLDLFIDYSLSQEKPELVITGEHDTLGCKGYIGEFDCSQPMNLGPKDKRKDSSFKIVDGEKNDVWQVIRKRRKGYHGKQNGDIEINITSILSDRAFQLKHVCFFTKNAANATIHTIGMDEIKTEFKETFQLDIKDKGKKRSKWTKTCLFRELVLHSIRLIFRFDERRINNTINLKGVSIKGCREHDGNFDPIPEPIWNKTRDFCVNQLTLRSPWARRRPNDYKSFLINNQSWSTDWTILVGSPDPFVAPEMEDVVFEFSASDGNDFEWWNLCMDIRMASHIEFKLDAKFVTYIENKTICNRNISEWTRICYSPWGRDVIVTKGQVRIVYLKTKKTTLNRIEIRNVKLDVCRDHYTYDFTMHSNPGDYKVMTIKTIRNQTVTIYGIKNNEGGLDHSELYHYTDNTGNSGDNTTFTIGTNALVEKIMTVKDTIKLQWILPQKANEANICIINVISRFGKFTAKMHINIDKLQVISKERTDNIQPNSGPTIDPHSKKPKAQVNVKLCNKDADDVHVFASLVTRKSSLDEMARYSGKPGIYEIFLATNKSTKNKSKLCDDFIKVKTDECKGHAFLDRSRYRFICQQMRLILMGFTAVTLDDRSRIHEACDMAFRTINIVCRVTTDSPNPSMTSYFKNACEENRVKFVDKFPKEVNSITLTPIARDNSAREEEGDQKNITLPPNGMPQLFVNHTGYQVVLTTVPIKPNKNDGYKLIISYSCATVRRTPDTLSIGFAANTLTTNANRDVSQPCVIKETNGNCTRDILPQTLNDTFAVKTNHFRIKYLQLGSRSIIENERDYFVVLDDISVIV